MTTTNADSEPLESHAVHCQRMLDHAAQMIEDGDRIQASEKMWGAFAHRVEAIAAQRGWECKTHDDLRVIAEHIARRMDNAGILDLYHHANNAHQNFYKDRLSLPDIVGLLERIQALLPLLDPDDPNLPQADDPPTNNRYRERHNLDALPPDLWCKRERVLQRFTELRRAADVERQCAVLEAAIESLERDAPAAD